MSILELILTFKNHEIIAFIVSNDIRLNVIYL